jgi:hypothetical protein
MTCDSSSFLPASDAKISSRDYAVIFKEICAIQQSILVQIDLHKRSTLVPHMTSSTPATYAWVAVAVPKTNVNGTVYVQTISPANPNAGDVWVSPSPSGITWHTPVRLATTADIDIITGGLLVIDGIQTVDQDRVLVKNQTRPEQNGLFAASEFGWARVVDFNLDTDVPNAAVYVTEGTQANTGWVVQSTDVDLGMDPLLWGIVLSTETGLLYTKLYTNTSPVTVDVNTPMTTPQDLNNDAKPDSYPYYDVVAGTSKDPIIQDQIDYVKKHFTDLGYSITLAENPSTGTTLQWTVKW